MIAVIEGKTAEVIADLRQRMAQHATNQQYERAAKLRDVIENLKTVFGAQNRTFTRSTMATYPGEAGVRELHAALALPAPPTVIECFDISNIMGQFTVASMVRFVDGAPARQAYRRFRIKEVVGIDDFASMAEVVERRYRRLLDEAGRLPELIVIDGGRGQLNAAHERLCALGLGALPILGLAKREEEIYLCWIGASHCVWSVTRPRCGCCKPSATKPTASPSPTTRPCAASA